MTNQNEKIKELLEVIQEHPDLPIIPMVDSEVIADDECGYWMGSWGGCKVDKLWIGEERVHFYDDDDYEGVEYDGADIGIEDDITDEEVDERYKNLHWIEAIVVYIDLPDSDF